jgi:hypothetical protein
MLTGDIGPPNILTLAGVKWLTPPIDIAIWVSQNREDLFEASLYHFGTQERRLEAKLLRIDVTDAEISLECEGALRPTALSGTETDNVALDFSLPSQNLCVLKIARN